MSLGCGGTREAVAQDIEGLVSWDEGSERCPSLGVMFQRLDDEADLFDSGARRHFERDSECRIL
jgi:hypothetical protein